MLTTLCIEHFTIVKRLELDFSHGMTAFTGETGAGKSIMIDALMLALGARADASVVRPGEAQCDITAGFIFDKDSEPAEWLIEHDIPCDEGELYLRRVIYAGGRSKSYINGQPFPLLKVKELSERLVHIHGQHQHYALMEQIAQRQQLDQYANHPELLQETKRLYLQWSAVKQELEELLNQKQQSDRIQLLQFQIDELLALNLQEGEIQALHQEHQMLHHAKEYLEHSQQIHALLSGEDEPGIASGLNQIMQSLQMLPHDEPHIKSALELINGAIIQCDEAYNEIQHFADKIQLDPERLYEVEERMTAIHQCARKHHVDGSALREHAQSIQKELDDLQNASVRLAALETQLAHLAEEYTKAAAQLSQSRQHYAQKLSKEITNTIQKLGMPKGWIDIDIIPTDKMQPHGMDKIEYKVCTNPGMEPDLLHKIASGGELSRIGLAIQMITAQKGATPTLLFDEVDVGIGGATAALVGQMLRKLGERLQVFCVTHQPQVAASAHHHFRVEKNSDQKQTFTRITQLEFLDKVDEIARMLGGLTITEQTRSHAHELLHQSH